MLFGIKKQSLFSLIMGLSLVGSHAQAGIFDFELVEQIKKLIVVVTTLTEKLNSTDGSQVETVVKDSLSQGGKAFAQEAVGSFKEGIRPLASEVVATANDNFQPNGEGAKAAKTVLNSLKTAVQESGIIDVVGTKMVKYSVMSVLAYGIARYVPKYASAYICEKVKKPAVIVEWYQYSPLGTFLNFSKTPALAKKVALSTQLKNRVNRLSKHARSVRVNRFVKKDVYPNVCVTGEYGSGKTAIARKIARKTNLDYAIVPAHLLFEKEGQTAAIDDLFAWIGRYNSDLCLVIDGADLLFSDRSKLDPSSNEYRTISHFMACLETYKNKLMLVITSKDPVVDKVASGYISETVCTQLPTTQVVEGTQKADGVAVTALA